MVFCFVQNYFFRTTQELEYLFFLSHKAQFFFLQSNIRLYDKNSESDYFFLLSIPSKIFCIVLISRSTEAVDQKLRQEQAGFRKDRGCIDHIIQVLEYLFFLSHKAQFFFLQFNIRLYDKNSESDYFFFPLHQNQNIFFSNIGNQNIVLEKNPYFLIL
jgi:hypothetical protein